MKKVLLVLTLALITLGLFGQDAASSTWKGLIRFKPAATLVGLAIGIPELVVDWIPYVSPSLGIPIEVDIATAGGSIAVGVLSGVEGVLLGTKEKNGMFLTALGGVYLAGGYIIFGGRADIGYQLVSNKGFVFTPAAGFKYNSFSGFSFDLMLDIGFAYR
jgi:hypothetical protein